ncbi:Uncharacterised protein [Mycobacteroides abscessus]|nr:Uncharacterised protein [Mycobacteroides abscessus]
MNYLEAIGKVLVVGLILGAGLPAVFAAGLVAYSSGAGGTHDDGTVVAPNPAVKFLGLALFTLVGALSSSHCYGSPGPRSFTTPASTSSRS